MPLADSHRDSLAGLTLDDVLANRAAASSRQLTNYRRTLLDVIREDESSKKDRKSWKAFKDKLRLKRAGSAWTSSVLIPASDVPFPILNNRNLFAQLPRRSSVRILTFSPVDVTAHSMADPTEEAIKSSNLAAMITRQRSTRQVGDPFFPDEKLKPQMSRPNSARLAAAVRADSIRRERVVTFRDNDSDDEEDGDGHNHQRKKERQMSAREAVAAQEAAEAAAMAEEEEEVEDEEEKPFGTGGGTVTMSLMDLLEETDRQMGLQGSTYRMEDDDDDDEEDFDEDEDDDDEEGEEHDCCVCMVKHRGAAFVPCGHSFCRMCSRELTVSKGNCPLCNNFILDILEVF